MTRYFFSLAHVSKVKSQEELLTRKVNLGKSPSLNLGKSPSVAKLRQSPSFPYHYQNNSTNALHPTSWWKVSHAASIDTWSPDKGAKMYYLLLLCCWQSKGSGCKGSWIWTFFVVPWPLFMIRVTAFLSTLQQMYICGRLRVLCGPVRAGSLPTEGCRQVMDVEYRCRAEE